MSGGRGRADRFNRGIGRHHMLVAAAAVVASFALHATLLARLDRLLPIPAPARIEAKRFSTIEMTDVRVDPPVIDTVERQPLDRPDAAATLPEGDLGLEELAPPEPPRQELAEAAAQVADPAGSGPEDALPPAVRQEVLAIQDSVYDEEISALPRKWVEQDVPRIERAPDIQLPVEVGGLAAGGGELSRADMPSLDDPASSGTPEWSALLYGRQGGGIDAPALVPIAASGDLREMLDERPDEVSRLEPIEDLLQVRVAGHSDNTGDGSIYFTLHIERASEEQLPVLPRDILFIQDSSESITPWKLDECRRGLKGWLDYLNEGDRFEVLSFREDITRCFGGWTAWNDENRRRAYTFIDGMRAEGNTDVFKSIQSAMAIEPEEGRVMLVVLVTDGRPTVGVTGSSDIIERVTRDNDGRVAVFTVGGGKKVNSFFLDLLSYRNRGDAIVVKGEDEIPGAMEAWAGQMRRPVLTDLSYRFANVDDADIYPKQLTHLFLDRPLVIHGRLPADSERFVFQVVGEAGSRRHDMVFVIERDQIAMGPTTLREQWAWQKIYHMIGDYIGDESPEKLEEIRTFADRYGLIVPYGFSRALPRRL